MLLIVLNLITVVTLAVLMFLLIIQPGKNDRKRNRYLILLFLLLVADLTLIHFQMLGQISIATYVPIGVTLIVWYGPAYYFYVLDVYSENGKLFPIHLLVSGSGIWLIFYLARNEIFIVPNWGLSSYFISWMIIYLVKSHLVIQRNNHQKVQGWMKSCQWWFTGLILFFLTESIWLSIDMQSQLKASPYFILTFSLINLTFVLFNFYLIVRNPSIFSEVKLVRKYQDQQNEVSASELALLDDFVLKQRKFSDPLMSRQIIMEETGLSINRISEIINSNFKKNFNDWINDYRINEAKSRLLKSEESIKEICFSVGFNSKSAFNLAFKKREGLTPSEFRIDQKESLPMG